MKKKPKTSFNKIVEIINNQLDQTEERLLAMEDKVEEQRTKIMIFLYQCHSSQK